jgi:hypothetical protein
MLHLEQGYQKPGERSQMDLFMDSSATSLVHGVVHALSRRDSRQAAEFLEKLYQADPGNARRGSLERLVAAARQQDGPVQDPGLELELLEQELLPLAEDLLGAGSRHFLIPLWRRLHKALAGKPFDPAHPELHSSHTAKRILDWGQVVATVEGETDWRRQPVLLRRHALACERLRRSADTALDLFELCWRFPEQVPEVMEGGVLDMIHAWHLFAELEPELDITAFPAWLLIIRPGMVNWLPRPEASHPEDYRLTYSLQKNQTDTGRAEVVQLRAGLKALSPALFRHFIVNLSR